MGARAIILSGGYSHPFAQSSPALARLMEQAGYDIEIEGNIDAAIAALGQCPALFAINALYWSMVQHEKYASERAEYAYHLPDAHLAAMERYVAQGGRLFVLHVSTICFDTQPGWHDLMGGGWTWGRSHHPPMGRITVELTDLGTEISSGPARFELIDEAYHNLDPRPDCEILAHCTIDEGPQPVAWIRQYGQGRVAVDALGHDARSIEAEGHRQLIAAQLAWLARDA